MSFGFRILVEGDYACFTRPEFKTERVSYDVPTPGALEGLIKAVYWKPAIRYVIDKIVVFNPINFINIRRNEVKDKVSLKKMCDQMMQKGSDPCIYTSVSRSQRAAMILKYVKYGIDFHFELTGLKSDHDDENEKKHYNMLKKRLEKGQYFKIPCLGCAEFSVRRIDLVDEFDLSLINSAVLDMGDVDLGFMTYRLRFDDEFSDKATTEYYRPHMINGVIDVRRYREEIKC